MVSYKTKVFGIINIVINLISLFAHVLLLVFSLFTGGLTSLLVEDIASNIGVVGLIVFGVVLVIMVYSIIAVVFIMIYLFLHIKAYSKFSENRISKVFMFLNLIILAIFLRSIGFNYVSNLYNNTVLSEITLIQTIAFFVYFINPIIGIVYSFFGIFDAYKIEKIKKLNVVT